MSTSSRLSRCPNAVLQMGVPRTAPFTLLSAPLPPNMCPHQVPEGGRCAYRVTVYTANERGAGTGADRGVGRANYISHSFLIPPHHRLCAADANVTMVLYGEKGDTGERKLDTSAVREDGGGWDGHRRKPGW